MRGNQSGQNRTAKWNLKYDPERIKQITTEGKPTYLEHASTAFNELHDMEIAVKNVLNTAGVPIPQVPSYLAFGREMWSKCKTHAGALMADEAATLIGKWVSRQLQQAVLENIRSNVFNVPAPTP